MLILDHSDEELCQFEVEKCDSINQTVMKRQISSKYYIKKPEVNLGIAGEAKTL